MSRGKCEEKTSGVVCGLSYSYVLGKVQRGIYTKIELGLVSFQMTHSDSYTKSSESDCRLNY